MFLKEADYPFIAMLEANWRTIRQELDQLGGEHFFAWPEKQYYGEGWNIFALYTYGVALGKNCKLCPETARLVQQIPGMATAVFSSLAPGTHVRPHRGEPAGLLRYHLGLIVPEGCTLRVGPEQRSLREGGSMVFDDTTEHEAWNRSDRTRVVLLVDFKDPAATKSRGLATIFGMFKRP
ncbi:aspartyl/asparaginyl beta-hydroxylase domain-containing protein [Gloeobacter kilaueensis]|uniref:Aspartyl/asparaginyl beta-hydroxylase n=1 Tax=Gloeobacter kilaueensis (strain ATCC BAA-2537 / CCAP 1431/1 / ULC 316 / JS1) TaxID=1183438 RepID=U5QNG9_GLOK1|nr:aspartyl/asparaginyl beta-hydroxylase domain-containing protein [Gloeobacter kilaueensis]AGY60471.1 aspartyl/asparaginyl beta-hydroxylase [Gloeobacter kilaueensis JS1]